MAEDIKPWGMEEKSFLMLMHLSQLAGFVFPGAGLALPIIMWATTKDQSDTIDQHGKIIMNWIISAIIYTIICVILIFVVVGAFALIALAIIGVVFAIIGAIKANEGKQWVYPLSIQFFSIKKELA